MKEHDAPGMHTVLEGIRVLDLSRLLPGAMCTRILGDLGADVLKVEEPGRGDYLRAFPPLEGAQGAMFNELNSGKRSLALNLKSERGREILRDLAGRADVLIEGFRPGTLARLGLTPESLRLANPRLVGCSISGFGRSGPLRDRAGHDLNYLGHAGMLPMFTPRGGGTPIVPGVQLADYGSGAYGATIGILAALFGRERTGRGRWVNISMTEGLLQWMALAAAELRAAGHVTTGGRGLLSGGYACYSVYPTSDDRAITVAAVEPKFWATLCRLIDRERFIPLQHGDWSDQAMMFEDLGRLFRTRSRDEWIAFCGDADVCVGPVLDLDEALARQQEYAAPRPETATPGRSVGPLYGGRASGPAPALGQHSRQVLEELGIGVDEIAGLIAAAVVQQPEGGS